MASVLAEASILHGILHSARMLVSRFCGNFCVLRIAEFRDPLQV